MQNLVPSSVESKAFSINACLQAAIVPPSIADGEFGLWTISRQKAVNQADLLRVGRPDGRITTLSRLTSATMHLRLGEIVMEDSNQELLRHAPAWTAARGRVLVTGLGLGCVVRGLLVCPAVESVVVIERCEDIIRAVAPSFAHEARLEIVHADATKWRPPPGQNFDMAWHDIWTDEDDGEPALQVAHGQMLFAYRDFVGVQGAWQFPRAFKRLYREARLNYLRRA